MDGTRPMCKTRLRETTQRGLLPRRIFLSQNQNHLPSSQTNLGQERTINEYAARLH